MPKAGLTNRSFRRIRFRRRVALPAETVARPQRKSWMTLLKTSPEWGDRTRLKRHISARAEISVPGPRYPVPVNTKYPLALTAALIADPGRAAILTALLDRRSLPAGELARFAGVSAQSASMHVAQLVAGGFLRVWQEGRHRYYCIATPEVAYAIESLGAISRSEKYTPCRADKALRYARTCYDHLAGALAVRLTTTLERSGLMVARREREYELTRRGEDFLNNWGIDANVLRRSHRSFARRCLDWTERQHHLAGAVGAAICQKLLDFRWIVPDRNSRVVYVSPAGRQQFARLLEPKHL
jgi:DNA-binding transcriptional ArsR family regulator